MQYTINHMVLFIINTAEKGGKSHKLFQSISFSHCNVFCEGKMVTQFHKWLEWFVHQYWRKMAGIQWKIGSISVLQSNRHAGGPLVRYSDGWAQSKLVKDLIITENMNELLVYVDTKVAAWSFQKKSPLQATITSTICNQVWISALLA